VAAANVEPCNTMNALEMAKKIVSKWVKVSALVEDNILTATTSETITPLAITASTATIYTKDLFTLGLLWHGFHDSIRESDGDRIFLYWKFLLPVLNKNDTTITLSEHLN